MSDCNISFEKIFPGKYCTWGVLKDKLFTGWGENVYGQLDDLIKLSGKVSGLDTFELTTLVLLEDGSITGLSGQANPSDLRNPIYNRLPLQNIGTSAKKIVCGWDYAAALKQNTEAAVWGGGDLYLSGVSVNLGEPIQIMNDFLLKSIIISGGATPTSTGEYPRDYKSYYVRNPDYNWWDGNSPEFKKTIIWNNLKKVWELTDYLFEYYGPDTILNILTQPGESTLSKKTPQNNATSDPKINLKIKISNSEINTSTGEYIFTGNLYNNHFLFKANNGNSISYDGSRWKIKDFQTGVFTGQNLYYKNNFSDDFWISLTGGANASEVFSIIISGGGTLTSTGEYVWTGDLINNYRKYTNLQNSNYIYKNSNSNTLTIKDLSIVKNVPFKTYKLDQESYNYNNFFDTMNWENFQGDPAQLPSGELTITITEAHEPTSTGDYVWTGETFLGIKILNHKYNNNFIYSKYDPENEETTLRVRDSLYPNARLNFDLYFTQTNELEKHTNWSGLHKAVSHIDPLAAPNGERILTISESTNENINGDYIWTGELSDNNNNKIYTHAVNNNYCIIVDTIFDRSDLQTPLYTSNSNTYERTRIWTNPINQNDTCKFDVRINISEAGFVRANRTYFWNLDSANPKYIDTNGSSIYIKKIQGIDYWVLNIIQTIIAPRDSYFQNLGEVFTNTTWQGDTAYFETAKSNVSIKISNAATNTSNGIYTWKGRMVNNKPYFVYDRNYIKYDPTLEAYAINDAIKPERITLNELDSYHFPYKSNFDSQGSWINYINPIEGSYPVPVAIQKLTISNSDVNVNNKYYLRQNNSDTYYAENTNDIIFYDTVETQKWVLKNNQNPTYYASGLFTYSRDGSYYSFGGLWGFEQTGVWRKTNDNNIDTNLSLDFSVEVLGIKDDLSPSTLPSYVTGKYVWTGDKINNYPKYSNESSPNLYIFREDGVDNYWNNKNFKLVNSSLSTATTGGLTYYSNDLITWSTGIGYFGAAPAPTGIRKNITGVKDIFANRYYSLLLTNENRLLHYHDRYGNYVPESLRKSSSEREENWQNVYNNLNINKPFTGILKVISSPGAFSALLDNNCITSWYDGMGDAYGDDKMDFTLQKLQSISQTNPGIQGRIIDIAFSKSDALLLLDNNTVTGVGVSDYITGSSKFYDKYNNVISIDAYSQNDSFNLLLDNGQVIQVRSNQDPDIGKPPICYKPNITFYDIPDKFVNDSPFSLDVSSSKAGIPITFKSSNTGVAQVDANGLVTIQNEGVTKIIAAQSATIDYPYTVSENKYLNVVNSSKTNSIINFPTIPNKIYAFNYEFNLNVTKENNSETPVVYSIDNPQVATVDTNGNIRLISVGEANVSAYQSGNGNYNYSSPIERSLRVEYAEPFSNCQNKTYRFISGYTGQLIIPTLNPKLPIIQIISGQEIANFIIDTCEPPPPYPSYRKLNGYGICDTRITGLFEYKKTGVAQVLFWQTKNEQQYDDSFCVFNITFLKQKIENTGLSYLESEEDLTINVEKPLYFKNFVSKSIDNEIVQLGSLENNGNWTTNQNKVNFYLNKFITLTSQDALVAQQGSNVTITPLKIGTILITGAITNPAAEPLNFIQTLNVEKTQTHLTLNSSPTIFRNSNAEWPIQIEYTTNNNQSPVLFNSSNPSVATVNSVGQIFGISPGISTITLDQAGSNDYIALEDDEKREVKVYLINESKLTNPINFNDIPIKRLSLDEDSNFQIVITNNINNQKPIFYFSSNPSVAQIDQYGWVSVLSKGYTKIGILQEDFGNYNLAFIEKNLLCINGNETTISSYYVDPIPNKLVGEYHDLVLKNSANNGVNPIHYCYDIVVDDPSSIDVSLQYIPDGPLPSDPEEEYEGSYHEVKRITFLKKGDIKLSIVPYLDYDPCAPFFVPFDTNVIVSKGPQNITFYDIPTKYYGNPPFSLSVSSSNSTIPITYASSNTSVATVNALGVVTIIGLGTTTFTASQAANTNWESTSASKILTISKTQRNINFPNIPNKNYGDSNFNLNVTSSDYQVPINYESSNTSVATVSSLGVVTIIGVGEAEISAYQPESENYSYGYGYKVFQVNKINAIITFPEIGNKIYQDPNFNLNVTSTNQVTQIIYSSSNTSVATVSSSGVVTVISAGSTIITASQASSNNYNAPLSVARTLLVTKKTPTFNFPIILEKSSNSAPFSIGVTSNNSTSPIVYSISNLLVATINQVGLVSIIGEGTTSIQVSQEETANWTSAISTRELQIIKPNPLIQTNIRYPKIIKLSNLPNNIFYNPIRKYLQGYLQDEGTYNIKIYIEENGVVCEKILSINAFKKYKKYIYPVNYPINVGFIKYNPHERIGLQPKIEAYDHPIFGKILRHSDLGIIYTRLSDSNNGNSTNTDPDFLLIVTEDELEGSQDVMGHIDIQLKYSSSLDKNYLTINGYPIYFYKNDLDMYSTKGKNNNWTLFDQNGQRILV